MNNVRILYISNSKKLEPKIAVDGDDTHALNSYNSLRHCVPNVFLELDFYKPSFIHSKKREVKKVVNRNFFARNINHLIEVLRILLSDIPKMHKIVRLLKLDLIYERSKIFRYFYLEPLLKRHKTKYFVEVEAPPVELKDTRQDSLFYKFAEGMENKKYKAADAIFTVSKALSEHLINRYNINGNKIHVIHNAADSNLFFTDEESRSLSRKEMNLEDKIVIGYVGVGYLPWHNLEILCESFRKISKQIKNMFLLLVGPEQEELINRGIDVNSIEENMLCIGQRSFPEMNKFINAMDICVLPGTNWYCSPVKLFEYGAVGKPIIAVDMPNVREIIPDENYALFFKKGDSNDLAEKMRILSLNKDLRNSLGEAFKNYSLSNFNWNKNAQSILKVYRETVKD